MVEHNIIERKIGEVFTFSDKNLVCKETPNGSIGCDFCVFFGTDVDGCYCTADYENIGPCDEYYRKDGKDVYFKEEVQDD